MNDNVGNHHCCGPSCAFLVPRSSDWVALNVGGQRFVTTKSTLASNPSSMLSLMFTSSDNSQAEQMGSSKDCTGAFLIDRSPKYFDIILDYLRHGKVICEDAVNLEGLLEEAKFYGLDDMCAVIEERLRVKWAKEESDALDRKDVIAILINSATHTILRFQGVNMFAADLSYLDLQNINFKYANMSHCDLSHANLNNCNFERANLSHAKLNCAQLSNVKMHCANLEDASIQGCNFEGLHPSSLEGANCKSVNLEGSQMCSVNLRVATLKNANMKNCVLRNAVFAGADLQNCDLTGCDLDNANLRGANFVGATFDRMITPLHMSQTINSQID